MTRSRMATPRRWSATLALAGALAAFPAHAEAPLQPRGTQAPGWWRMQLGGFEVTALYDGHVDLDSAIFKGKPAEIDALLAQAFQASPNMTSVNGYLINTGNKLVLVDAGAANLFGPTLGRLLANLEAAGYAPEQVDAVLITHLHADHVGGVATADGKMAFPNATVHVDKRESDHWLSKANLEAAPKEAKEFFEGAQAAAAPYVAAGKWKTYDSDAELVPGIRPVSYGRAPGHTPGHEGYLVESSGRKLLVWGDVVHSAAVQFPRPDVTIAFDVDPQAARATRMRLYDLAVKDRLIVAAAHISFPGLGHIRRQGSGYAWVPLQYGLPR